MDYKAEGTKGDRGRTGFVRLEWCWAYCGSGPAHRQKLSAMKKATQKKLQSFFFCHDRMGVEGICFDVNSK